MEDGLADNLRWLAERAGFRLLALPTEQSGFAEVRSTQRDSFYGISTEADASRVIATPYAKAVSDGLICGGYPELLYERARVIVEDMAEKAEAEGFGFFNGQVARLLDASQHENTLQLQFERSSYFSDLNMPIAYTPFNRQHPLLPPLAPEFFWVEGEWRRTLPASPLGKQGNVQLIVHNNEELFYILRGRVAFGRSVVSGLPSGSIEPSESLDAPLHELAIRKEAHEEMGLDLDRVSWLGLGARTSDCGIMLLGTAHTGLSRPELERRIGKASEGDEVGKLLSFSWRQAASSDEVLERALSEKLVARHEHPGGHRWNSIGPTSLLLTLAHLLDPEQLDRAIRRVKVRYEAVAA